MNDEELGFNCSIHVNLDIKNTGEVGGDEVVQVYVSYPHSAVARPVKALKGFIRTNIKKGEIKPVSIQIDKNDFRYWDVNQKELVLEKGDIELLIGASSQDIRLIKKVTIE